MAPTASKPYEVGNQSEQDFLAVVAVRHLGAPEPADRLAGLCSGALRLNVRICRRQGIPPSPEVGHVLELVRGAPASARSARRCALSRRPCETGCYRALPVGWKPVRTLPPFGSATGVR